MTLQIEENLFLLLILLLFLFISMIIFTAIVYINIKQNKYSIQSSNNTIFSISLVGCICGIFTAKLFLQNASQETIVIIISSILLILSFLAGIGSLNLLKAILYIKLKDTGNSSVC